jgi:hypothetical protein
MRVRLVHGFIDPQIGAAMESAATEIFRPSGKLTGKPANSRAMARRSADDRIGEWGATTPASAKAAGSETLPRGCRCDRDPVSQRQQDSQNRVLLHDYFLAKARPINSCCVLRAENTYRGLEAGAEINPPANPQPMWPTPKCIRRSRPVVDSHPVSRPVRCASTACHEGNASGTNIAVRVLGSYADAFPRRFRPGRIDVNDRCQKL